MRDGFFIAIAGLIVGAALILPVSAVGGVRGGIEVIDLPSGATAAQYRQRSVLVLQQPRPVAIVGIPLEAKLGMHHIVVGEQRIPFEVTDKAYPEQRLTIADQKMVNPPAADLQRIQRETELMRAQYQRFTPLRSSPFPLTRPATGPVSSAFGLRRILNGEARSPHAGLDIAAPRGDPAIAPADGIVSLTGNFYFNGNTVFIDHGGGLITMACHLDSIAVTQDEHITRGQVIGRVGATGRVTGPHLHWSLILNGERIDPVPLLALFAAPPTPAAQ
jgi:murein DD-endopeptidase MepM/ murein hydrolase activator NlpD